MLKLNLGCGLNIIPGWINADYVIGTRLAKAPFLHAINRRLKFFSSDRHSGITIQNLIKKFQWADNSVDVVYNSLTSEHMSRQN